MNIDTYVTTDVRTATPGSIQRMSGSAMRFYPLYRARQSCHALTWQDCHNELARRDIDPAWRTQVELRLENIRRGSS